MKTKKLAGAAAVGAVTAVTTLLLGATPAFAEAPKGDSAFALSASGLLDINPISQVKSVDGTLVHDELLSIGDVAGKYEDDLAFGLLTSEAESHRAETVVKEVNLLNILKADIIRTFCKNGKGGLEIVNGTVLGQKLPDTSVPSKDIDVSPLVKLSLNDQKRNTDGSLSVTGIKLTVLPAPEVADKGKKLTAQEKAALPVIGGLLGKELPVSTDTVGGLVGELGGLASGGDLQTITIGNATCQEGAASGDGDDAGDDGKSSDGKDDNDGKGDNDGKDKDGKGDNDGKDGKDSDVKSAGEAPAPTVVKAALPVTG